METVSLYVVVSYSSNERMFSESMLRSLDSMCSLVGSLSFGRQHARAIISIGSRLYTGDPEDEGHILGLRHKFNRIEFVRYNVNCLDDPIALHNAARIKGVEHATTLQTHKNCGRRAPGGDSGFWVLFLDGDELMEADAFAEWFVSKEGRFDLVSKLANYWYFMHPTLVSKVFEDSVLLAHSSTLTPKALTHPRERDGIVSCAGRNGPRNVLGINGRPMFHHYSWVRSDEKELLRKVSNWGHKNDKPWDNLIRMYTQDIKERGIWPQRDFVHGYELVRIPEDKVRFQDLLFQGSQN